MKNTYEMDHIVVTNETDAYGYWRADAAFRLLQDMADIHSGIIGIAREDIMRKINCIWMLGRVALHIKKYPRFRDRLHAITWYGERGRTTFPRFLSIMDESGEEVAALASAAIVVSMEDRRIVLPSKVNLEFPPMADKIPTVPEPQKIRMLKEGERKVTHRAPLYSDVDINGHMNNTNYITWIMDLFALEWHAKHRLSDLTIGYSAEAKPGEDVEITLYQTGLAFETLGIDPIDGHTVFEAKGSFINTEEI